MLGASSPPEQQQAQAQMPVESLSLEAQFTRAQARVSGAAHPIDFIPACALRGCVNKGQGFRVLQASRGAAQSLHPCLHQRENLTK